MSAFRQGEANSVASLSLPVPPQSGPFPIVHLKPHLGVCGA